MIPVRTNASTVLYKGDPATGVQDVWCERTGGSIGITWKPTDEERAEIAAGGLIQLAIFTEPIPPVMVGVSRRQEISAIGEQIRNRAIRVLALTFPERPDSIPPGRWVVSKDVAIDMSASGALDPNDSGDPDRPPTLFGRIVAIDDEHTGHAKLVYERSLEVPGGQARPS